MSAAERRIVHEYLREREDVATQSEGDGLDTKYTIVADSNKEMDVVLAKVEAPPQHQRATPPPVDKKKKKKSSETTLPDDDMKTLAPVFN